MITLTQCGRFRPEAVLQIAELGGGNAARAVGRGWVLRSRCLARSRHRLTQEQCGINDRYREGCSHPAWQAPGTPSNRDRMSATRRAEVTLPTLCGQTAGRTTNDKSVVRHLSLIALLYEKAELFNINCLFRSSASTRCCVGGCSDLDDIN